MIHIQDFERESDVTDFLPNRDFPFSYISDRDNFVKCTNSFMRVFAFDRGRTAHGTVAVRGRCQRELLFVRSVQRYLSK